MRNISRLSVFVFMAFAAVSLSACESTKAQLGLNRQSPDEFAIVKRAPLEMPPSYTLRPPEPGASRPQERATNEQARTVVFGAEDKSVQPASQPTNAEEGLLQKAGADMAQPGIRQKVDYETATLEPKEQPVAKKLLGIGKNNPPPATIVDAQAEALRLKKNREEGKAITDGETPSIEQ